MAVIGIDEDTIMLSGSHRAAYESQLDDETFDDVIALLHRKDVPEALRLIERIMRSTGAFCAGFADDVERYYRRAQ